MVLLCEQRKRCLELLSQQFNLQWSIISGGGFRHEGHGPPYVFEAFMEVCSILLFVGDVFGYIAVDEDGVVDPLRSYSPFLERFVLSIEIMHTWCMRHPPHGHTPKDRRWLTRGVHCKVLHSVSPLLRLRMVNAVYPHVKDDVLIPEGVLILPDFKLRALFLRTSKSVIDLASDGSYGQCEPLRFSQDIQCVGVYLGTQRVKPQCFASEFTRVGVPKCKEQPVIALRLAASFDPVELCEEDSHEGVNAEWELYYNFEAYSPLESIYDEVKELLGAEGVQV